MLDDDFVPSNQTPKKMKVESPSTSTPSRIVKRDTPTPKQGTPKAVKQGSTTPTTRKNTPNKQSSSQKKSIKKESDDGIYIDPPLLTLP